MDPGTSTTAGPFMLSSRHWQVWLHWNGADAASLGFCTVITPGRLLQNLPLAVIVLNVFAPGSAPFIFSFLGATPPTSTTASCVKCEPVIVNKNVPFDARSTEHAVTAATSARDVVRFWLCPFGPLTKIRNV